MWGTEREPSGGRLDGRQCTEHDPGPPGSPHVSHAPDGMLTVDFAGVLDCAANTETCFARSRPEQFGHTG